MNEEQQGLTEARIKTSRGVAKDDRREKDEDSGS